MSNFNTLILRGMLPALLIISLHGVAQTITSDVGTTICKGQTVLMTADNYAEWEVITDGGANWSTLVQGNSYASANIANGSKYRVKLSDYSSFPPSETYSNILTFTVNGEKAGINTISAPSRGSIEFNGLDQAFQMTPGISVGANAFTFDGWFRLKDVPKIKDTDPYMYTLFGSTSGDRPMSVMLADPTTVRFQSFGCCSLDFTVPKLSTGIWYHLVMVRDGSKNMTVFLNGTRSSSGIIQNTSDLNNNIGLSGYIGRNPDQNRFNGFLSNVRMVTGSALYEPTQSSITVPTAPLSSVTNTKLLLLANSAATVATDASSTQTLSANGTAPSWAANSPFRESITAARTVSNSVAGGT
jgi:hypothetical protein